MIGFGMTKKWMTQSRQLLNERYTQEGCSRVRSLHGIDRTENLDEWLMEASIHVFSHSYHVLWSGCYRWNMIEHCVCILLPPCLNSYAKQTLL
jgi:hypothetical protein